MIFIEFIKKNFKHILNERGQSCMYLVECDTKLYKNHDKKKVNSTYFKQIIDNLIIYLPVTRSYNMYFMSLINRYMENPKKLYLLTVKKNFSLFIRNS